MARFTPGGESGVELYPKNPNAWKLVRQQLEAAVGRSVVDYDCFEVLIVLAKHVRQILAEQGLHR